MYVLLDFFVATCRLTAKWRKSKKGEIFWGCVGQGWLGLSYTVHVAFSFVYCSGNIVYFSEKFVLELTLQRK